MLSGYIVRLILYADAIVILNCRNATVGKAEELDLLERGQHHQHAKAA